MLHKVFKTIDEQLEILKGRGLIVDNEETAKEVLGTHNYYRLSGYMLTLKKNDVFDKTATFDNVLQIYSFDRALRLLMLDYLEEIEITLRSRVGHEMGRDDIDEDKRVAYLDASLYMTEEAFLDFSADLRKAIKDCQNEAFVKHHKTKYSGILPAWAMVETLSFGALSRLYSGLNTDLQKRIGGYYSLRFTTIENWLHSIVVLRNICAHHLRLFNRGIPISPKFTPAVVKYFRSQGYEANQIGGKLFFRLVVIARLLNSPESAERVIGDIKELSSKYPFVNLKYYGFKKNWEDIFRGAVALCFGGNK